MATMIVRITLEREDGTRVHEVVGQATQPLCADIRRSPEDGIRVDGLVLFGFTYTPDCRNVDPWEQSESR